ncbi:acyltransferase [Dokdonella sp.]|uniref:acyltransferase family protein n=1 Tax=Dokdonella sp. TaxID=2291710 RepID=UPI002F41DA89
MSTGAPAPSAHDEARLRHIDALRGIAALLVLWRHVADAYVGLGPGVSGRWLAGIADSIDVGRIGVVAFFLISGYVIPFSIRPERTAPVGTFLIKRFFRIYPAYWLSIPLGAFATCWLWGRPFGVREFLVNLTLLQDFFGVTAAEGLYWTLLVEWAFYLLCVVLLLCGSLGRPRHLLALSIMFTLAYSVEMFVRWSTGASLIGSKAAFAFLNLSLMLVGTLYRMVVDQASSAGGRLRTALSGLLLWHLLALPLGATWAIGFEGNATIPYAIGLTLFLLGTSVVRIRSTLTDRLGRISYSIYLFHPVVFMVLLWCLLRLPVESALRSQHLAVYLLVNALLTVVLAAFVHRWVERPGMELGRRCARAWSRLRLRAPERPVGVPVAGLSGEHQPGA